jgi:glucose-1-phosphate cytidylyltransferase
MKVVILCGGFGTRIRDVSEHIPKPMIQIGPLPILVHIMKHYSYYGFKDFILCLGYKSEIIKDFFLNYKSRVSNFTLSLNRENKILYHSKFHADEWKISLIDTGINSMTGSRISQIRDLVDGDFMLTYGDAVSDINLNHLKIFHNTHNKILTVTGVRPPGRFGELQADNELVYSFNEKPQASSGRVSGGFFVAKTKIFDYLKDNEDLVFEENPMSEIVKAKELMMFKHDGFWQPMDTSRDYRLLNEMFSKKDVKWKL